MDVVYVKIKDEKHANKVIKRLVRVGYKNYHSFFTLSLDQVKAIAVYSDGEYQLLSHERNNEIRPKDLMNSEPVNYFLENNHV